MLTHGAGQVGYEAIRRFVDIYPPPKVNGSNSRHAGNPDSLSQDKGMHHLALWQMTGHEDRKSVAKEVARGANISQDAWPAKGRVGGLVNVDCVVRFFLDLTPVLQAAGAVFEVLDLPNFRRYKGRFDELARTTGLWSFKTTRYACFVGLALLSGLECNAHRDVRDREDGWVADLAFGDFEGGHLQLPHLGVEIRLRPGDALFLRSNLLWHAVGEVTRGQRYATVLFTHGKFLEPGWRPEGGEEDT